MKTILVSLFFAAVLVVFHVQISLAQTLKADYQFQGNLNSSIGNAPPLTDLVGAGNGLNGFRTDTVDGYSRQVLDFPSNNGVNIPDLTAIVPDTTKLTVVMLFQFTDPQMQSKKLRLFDYSACQSQTGGRYLLNGKIEGETGSHAASRQFTYLQVVITRSGLGGNVTIYRDGQIATTEPDDGSTLPFGLRFFHDCTWGLATTGSVARIRIYDGAMTAQQVHALDRVPESTVGTLPALFWSNRSGVNEIYRMDAVGGSQVRITNNDAKPELHAKFSPNGQKIVYQRRESGADPWQVWISNADGGNPVRLTNTTSTDKAPSWRPDGQKILFSRCIVGVCDLYTMDPDGSNQTAVFTTTTDEDLAVFTPNGQKLVFNCNDAASPSTYQLCVSDANGSNRVVIPGTTGGFDADISPDGSKVAFDQGSVIKTMNLDGSNVTTWPSTNSPQIPLWSPDGSKIMYTRFVGAFLEIFVANADGSSPVQITLNSADDIATDWYRPAALRRALFDYDGDGRSDVSVFRPSDGNWYVLRSTLGFTAIHFGIDTDVTVPGDYDGDGKTDYAVYRPSSGVWYLQQSTAGFAALQFGLSTDLVVPGDYDGDGKTDFAVFRPSTGVWYLQRSTAGFGAVQFGQAGDKPVAGDFDGDGKTDYAVYRPSNGVWYLLQSTAGFAALQFGLSTDLVVPGDYDGDGKTDIAVFRPSTGVWYFQRSTAGFGAAQFGTTGDLPSPGDYDGDGKTDVAVFRPGAQSVFYIQGTTTGFNAVPWGIAEDRPIPNAFVR